MNDPNLHGQLDHLLQAITPTPTPIEATMKLGKRVRWRRRAIATADATAVVAAAIFVSAGLPHSQAVPKPVTSHRGGGYSVTVEPPGPHSPAGEIAQGTVNGKAWRLVPATNVSGSSAGCYEITGIPFANTACDAPSYNFDSADAPADFQQVSAITYPMFLEWTTVAPDVTYLTATLNNGSVLTLRPVTSEGVRYVAIVVPPNVLRTLTAYSAAGEIASISPFNGSDMYYFTSWLKPGQHGLPRSTTLIGSGKFEGVTWWVRAYLGPAGACIFGSPLNLDAAPGGGCTGSMRELTQTGQLMSGSLLVAFWGPHDNVVLGVAPRDVTRIVVTLPDGKTETVRLVTVEGQQLWAFGYQQVVHWTAYSATGHVVASGTTHI